MAGKILDFPVYSTTQNSRRLGATVEELRRNFTEDTKDVDKTAFSMVGQQVECEEGGVNCPLTAFRWFRKSRRGC